MKKIEINKIKIKKLKKGDEVQVLSGKDKGKKGKIEAILTKERKVVVTNINQYKRHLKRRSQNQPSEIITLTKPLPIGVVALVCPKCHLPTRVGFKKDKSGMNRFCKKCEAQI
jgi:large subunit ribosomal protein L24